MSGYAILALGLLIGGFIPVLVMGAIGHSFNRLVALQMGSPSASSSCLFC